MSDANDVLGTEGAGEVVISLDQAWTMHPVGPRARGAFGAWARARARREIETTRREMGENAYRADLAVFQSECGAGAYSWGSPFDPKGMGSGVAAALGQWEGQAKLIGLLLEPAHGELEPEHLAEVIEGNRAGFIEALTRCLDAAPVPNGKAPPTEGKKATAGRDGGAASPTATSTPSSAGSPSPGR